MSSGYVIGFAYGCPSLSNPILTSGLDLLLVVPDSTIPCFVTSQLVALCQLGFLIMFLLSLNVSFILSKSGVCVN